MRRNNFPDIPFCSNLKIRPSCQTLSNAKPYQMSIKNWLIQESPGLKPDWFVEIRRFVVKKLNISSYEKRSNIFPHLGRNEIGQ